MTKYLQALYVYITVVPVREKYLLAKHTLSL